MQRFPLWVVGFGLSFAALGACGDDETKSSTSGNGGDASGGMGTGGDGTGGGDDNCPTEGGVGSCISSGACDDCLDAACSASLAACDTECVAIEGCIEMICKNIPDATEEGQCQVYCQGLHPAGEAKHLAMVNCAFADGNSHQCQASMDCDFYPDDYDACRATMAGDKCADDLAACNANLDCTAYRDCVASCATVNACIQCSATPEAQAGRLLLEAAEFCFATECASESWLP
jgi:hypothetical protein